MALFWRLIEVMPAPPNLILDLGGMGSFWLEYGLNDHPSIHILTVNLEPHPPLHDRIQSIVADARDLSRWADRSVDVIFSNSLVEHLGSWRDQQQFAGEVCRVARTYFVQTPNRNFPLEPHFMLPGFQSLPLVWQIRLVQRFALGHMPRLMDAGAAERAIRQIRLLDAREMKMLFPGAYLWREHVAGLSKSLVAISAGDMGRGAY